MLNPPLRRYCDFCWKLRPGWLAPPTRYPQKQPMHRHSTLPFTVHDKEDMLPSSQSTSQSSVPQCSVENLSSSLGSLTQIQNFPSSQPENLSRCQPDTLSASQPENLSDYQSENLLDSQQELTSSQHPESLGPVTVDTDLAEKCAVRRTDSCDTLPASDISLDDCLNEQSRNEHSPCRKRLAQEVGGSTKRARLCSSNGSNSASKQNNICQLCLSGPKDAALIHGRSSHQMCCYPCAKKLRRHGRPCPACRRPIQRVTRNYIL